MATTARLCLFSALLGECDLARLALSLTRRSYACGRSSLARSASHADEGSAADAATVLFLWRYVEAQCSRLYDFLFPVPSHGPLHAGSAVGLRRLHEGHSEGQPRQRPLKVGAEWFCGRAPMAACARLRRTKSALSKASTVTWRIEEQ